MPDERQIDIRRAKLSAGRAALRTLGVAHRDAAKARTIAVEQARTAQKAGDTKKAAQFNAQAAAHGATVTATAKRRFDMRKELGGLIDGSSDDPCDCSAARPLLLLPVRLETRFRRDADNKITHLRVRIFPDTIHNDTLRRELDPNETSAGTAYQNSDKTDADWARLVESVGARRAAWIAERTRPGAPLPAPEDADGSVARLLPDRFIVRAFKGLSEKEVVGAAITDPVSLDLFGEVSKRDGEITYGFDAAWITDFNEAKAIGMAVEMEWTSDKVDRLIVVGVCGEGATETARQVDRLLEGHRFGAGLGFVAPGVPTNNVEEMRSGWEPGSAAKPDMAPVVAGSNRTRLATALGIEGRAFAGTEGATAQPDRDARACNAALWWATWGPLLEMIDVDVELRGKDNQPPKQVKFRLTDAQREDIRRFHRDALRGRGPLPTIRVGAQPYGILPVGLTAKAGWRASDTDALVLAGVQKARSFWDDTAGGPGPLGDGASNEKIAKVFGTAPVSQMVRARQAGAFTDVEGVETGGALKSDDALEAFLDTLMLEEYWNEGSVKNSVTSGGTVTTEDQLNNTHIFYENLRLSGVSKPVALPYAHDSDPQRLQEIANGQTGGKAKSVLQALAAIAMIKAKERQAGNLVAVMDQLGQIPGVAAAASIRGRSAAQEVDAMRAEGSGALFRIADRARTPAVMQATYRDYQPLGSGAGALSYADMALSAGNPEAKAELCQLGAHEVLWSEAIVSEHKEALLQLAKSHLSTADRHILVAEALDLASHRYDAWATALATRRARALRANAPAGLYVGAFGWLEDIKAGNPGEFGYIHAPGMAHAVTAGVLRSGYLAHKSEGAKGAFAIDLTSARVRVAMDLVEARRAGQSLGEALGYRIERGMHEKSLSRFIRNLRRFAWTLGKSAGGPTYGNVTESVASGRVMDGVKLIDLYRKGPSGIAEIKEAASLIPQDNPYLEGDWKGLQPSKEAPDLVAVIKDASDALDAVADLMVAESVHQLAQGNMARAAAVCDAASSGNSPLPMPDVIASPTRERTLDHLVMLLAGPGSGWAGGKSPRALAAPELEAWAARRLGPPNKVRLGTRRDKTPITMADTGLCAIDVVYLAASRANLEALVRTRAKLPVSTASPFMIERSNSGWVAGEISFGEMAAAAELLRAALESAQPATAKDFAGPNQPPAYSFATVTGLTRLNTAIATLGQRIVQLKAPLPANSVLATLFEFGIAAPQREPSAVARLQIVGELEGRLAATLKALGRSPDTAAIIAAGQALFGRGFWVLSPMLPVAAPNPWSAASTASPARLRRWMADMATVRPPLARFADGVLLSEALGGSASLSAVQLAEDDAGTLTTDFAGDRPPDGVGVLVLVERSGANNQPAVALVIDRFAEPLPDTGTRTSAVVFNAPAPGARPPQACLLAIAPDDTRWTTDRLIETVSEALTLSRIRGVTFEKLSTGSMVPRLLPAIYTNSWSLNGSDLVVDWGMAVGPLTHSMQFVKED